MHERDKLKVAFDCQLLYFTGIGVQIRGLVSGWQALAASGERIPDLTFIGKKPVMDTWPALEEIGHLHHTSHPMYRWRGRFLFPRLKHVSGTHFLNPHVPAFIRSQPYILTVHDLVPYIDQEWVPQGMPAWRLKYEIPWIAQGARHIITPSHNSADDLMRLLKVSSRKITVIPNAVDADWQVADEPPVHEFQNRDFAHPYFLTVGVNQAHKNYRWLIDSFSKWEGSLEHKLIIAGAQSSTQFPINDYLNEKGITSVINLGPVSQQKLNELYRNALAFIYPSLYEGFGIPVLEAQKSGVAVLSSNSSSLPEVAGNAALLFDPQEPDQLYSCLNEILNFDRRTELISAGYANIKRFSWKASARKTRDVYEEFLG